MSYSVVRVLNETYMDVLPFSYTFRRRAQKAADSLNEAYPKTEASLLEKIFATATSAPKWTVMENSLVDATLTRMAAVAGEEDPE